MGVVHLESNLGGKDLPVGTILLLEASKDILACGKEWNRK